MTRAKLTPFELKAIKHNYFVRKGLNQDHVLMLAELYEASLLENKGDELKASLAIAPIQLSQDGELIDGRHRKEAMELAQYKQAKVELYEVSKPSELVVMATRANYGGALPPSREDMIYTVDQLLHRCGLTQKQVEDQLTMLPKSVVRKYINMATRRHTEASLKLALSDMSFGGMSLKQAAKHRGVSEVSLQALIEGKKPKTKLGAGSLNSVLTSQVRGMGISVGKVINKMIEDYRDGEISEEVAQQVLNHFGHLMRRVFLRVADWDNRLKAVKAGVSEIDEKHSYNYTDVDGVTKDGK